MSVAWDTASPVALSVAALIILSNVPGLPSDMNDATSDVRRATLAGERTAVGA